MVCYFAHSEQSLKGLRSLCISISAINPKHTSGKKTYPDLRLKNYQSIILFSNQSRISNVDRIVFFFFKFKPVFWEIEFPTAMY